MRWTCELLAKRHHTRIIFLLSRAEHPSTRHDGEADYLRRHDRYDLLFYVLARAFTSLHFCHLLLTATNECAENDNDIQPLLLLRIFTSPF